MQVRDLDGDGRPDIIVASAGNHLVSVYRNLSTPGSLSAGSFAPRLDFATPDQALTVVAGDLNGDGKPELVTGNYTSISVFRNTSTPGSIGFAARADTTMSSWGVAVGDLDGDGKPDLAVANPDNNTVTVLRNTTTAMTNISFAAGVAFASGSFYVLGGYWGFERGRQAGRGYCRSSGDTASVFQNTSTPGSFDANSLAPRVTFTMGSGPREVVLADLDGDGRLDIVDANLTSSYVSIRQNVMPFGGFPPSIATQPTNQTVTVGGTATFSVTASGTPPLSYQWNFNGTNIGGATNTTLTLTNVQASQAGNYAVLVTNLFGSILSSNAVLTVTLDHFAWSPIPSPRFVNTPFAVTIQAQDLTNGLFTNFTGTAILGTTNGVAVTPPVSGNFIQGVWTGAVVISQTASNLVLRANDGLGTLRPGQSDQCHQPAQSGDVAFRQHCLVYVAGRIPGIRAGDFGQPVAGHVGRGSLFANPDR